MFKKTLLFVLILLAVFSGSANAVPERNIALYAYPYWQFDSGWAKKPYGWPSLNETIWGKGCALTSLTMMLRYHGFYWIPDKNHMPILDPNPLISYSLNPWTLNVWMLFND